ncbi:MAG: metallophosphoesterase [bacterium]|nr:metallophosphoesterase [bacterium]
MDRKQFLSCAGWFGVGLSWTLAGGLPVLAQAKPGSFSFVQISDSHLGFTGSANADVAGTLRAAIARINALPQRPDFIVHTGDVTHLSKPEQFALAKEILAESRSELIVLPGEHDLIGDKGAAYFAAFGRKENPEGWYSFDTAGAHFVALINVRAFEGMGKLGEDQLAWLERDLAGVKSDTPLILFAHVPLYAVYPRWGWSTEDSAAALAMTKRFASVTVLNGHIHQIQHAVEGRAQFYTARGTAYPLPAPGSADHPAPVTLAADELKRALGYRTVEIFAAGDARIDDMPLD